MAEKVFRIPLVAVPQRFAIDLNGLPFVLVCRWNPEMPAWVLDVYDGETEAPVLLCMPLVPGLDLLSQARHKPIPGSLVVVTDGDELAAPTLENLGAEANLYYVVDE